MNWWWSSGAPKPHFDVRISNDSNPLGGLGTLTPNEEVELDDLLNKGTRCECGMCSDECSSPIRKPL